MSERSSMSGRPTFARFARTSIQAAITLLVVLGLAVVVIGRIAPAGTADSGGGKASVPVPPQSASQASLAVACAPSRPDPVFVAPAPHPAPAVPPAYYKSSWFGTARLWTMLSDDGEIWRHLPTDPNGLSQKTFWWSVDWDSAAEPEPLMAVTGRRLDAPGTFSFGPGTNAGADFGTAMLVGIDVPTVGCWEITGRYRVATLSYRVLVEDPQAPRP
jgi:hypothetical protein